MNYMIEILNVNIDASLRRKIGGIRSTRGGLIRVRVQVHTFRMPQLELNKQITGEERKHSEENNQNQAGHQPDNCKRRWQREHAIADNLGNHEDCDELPC